MAQQHMSTIHHQANVLLDVTSIHWLANAFLPLFNLGFNIVVCVWVLSDKTLFTLTLLSVCDAIHY